MDPLSFQRQIRNNSEDLVNFCADLKQWGEEMKHNDDVLKTASDLEDNIPITTNQVKKSSKLTESITAKPKKKTKKRIKASDYGAWEKFDVEAECAKLDEHEKDNGSDDELTDEIDEDARDEAVYEKEKGNNFVKSQKWDQAIVCYTKAIQRYSYDPIFYANRSLCYLKKENYKAADSDCTSALQLDKTYVKAYQRRAAAREALGQLSEAHTDLLKVFDYEPNNKESKNALSKLEKKLENVNKIVPSKTSSVQRPKSKFTISRQHKIKPVIDKSASNNQDITTSIINSEPTKIHSYWSSGNEVELVEAVNKPPHLRSKKPLKRIVIQDVDTCEDSSQSNIIKEVAQPWPRPGIDNKLIKCDDFKVVERRIENPRLHEKECSASKFKQEKEKINIKPISITKNIEISVPTNSIQFTADWRLLHSNKELRYKYLKQINPNKIPTLFKESLDCDIFSGIINILAEMFTENNDSVYEYLSNLSDVKRFSMLTMFMSDADKKDLSKLAEYMLANNILKDKVEELISKYGL